MSALGQKQTCAVQKGMSALPPKADMCGALGHVRFGPKADMCSAQADVRFTPNRDIDCAFRMSTKGQKRTPGQFELALLFDDLASEAE